MPKRVGYEGADKVTGVFDMDQFRGLEKGEKRRICMMEKDAVMAVVHWVNNAGYCECTGDYAIVGKNTGGLDLENCPACKAASEAQQAPVGMPQRKFVCHILEYVTNNKGECLKPLNFRIKAWVFGNDKHGRLADRKEEFGDLRRRDLVITCEDKKWQRYDIVPSAGGAYWLTKGDEIKARVVELYREERRDDVGRLLGKTLSLDDLRAAVVKAMPSAVVDDEDFEGMLENDAVSDADVTSLLDVTLDDAPEEDVSGVEALEEAEVAVTDEVSVAVEAAPAEAAVEAPVALATKKKAAPVARKAAPKVQSEDEVLSSLEPAVDETVDLPETEFDDLLKDLGN